MQTKIPHFQSFQGLYNLTLEEYAFVDKGPGSPYEDRKKISMGRNQMLADFGVRVQDFDDPVVVNGKINEIDLTFDLLLVSERMEESLVLLK